MFFVAAGSSFTSVSVAQPLVPVGDGGPAVLVLQRPDVPQRHQPAHQHTPLTHSVNVQRGAPAALRPTSSPAPPPGPPHGCCRGEPL